MTAASRLSSGNAKQNDVLDIQNKQQVIKELLSKIFAQGVLPPQREEQLNVALTGQKAEPAEEKAKAKVETRKTMEMSSRMSLATR